MRFAAALLLLIPALACGGAMPEASAPVAQTVAASGGLAPPPADGAGDARFESDVSSPPPPRPTRQIDRDGDAPPPPPANLRKVDKTLGAGDGDTDAVAEAPHDAQMLVYTAHVTMSVYQVEPALDAIEGIARGMGGYLEARNDTEIHIRVPRARFDEALHKVESSGDVLHRDVSAQDVTDAFVDLEARLKNGRAVRDRLQALLEKAAVKEAIEIQKELERVTGEIESMEGKLKLLAHRVAYSSIDVIFQARGNAALQATPIRLPFPWLGELGLPKLLNLSTP